MANYVLYSSYVKHHRVFGQLKHKEILEGLNNKAWGQVIANYFFLEFFNSFGDKSFIEGRFFRVGPFAILKGKAYGYSNFPKGRFAFAFAFFGKRQLRLVVPAHDSSFLFIRLSYTEIPSD